MTLGLFMCGIIQPCDYFGKVTISDPKLSVNYKLGPCAILNQTDPLFPKQNISNPHNQTKPIPFILPKPTKAQSISPYNKKTPYPVLLIHPPLTSFCRQNPTPFSAIANIFVPLHFSKHLPSYPTFPRSMDPCNAPSYPR